MRRLVVVAVLLSVLVAAVHANEPPQGEYAHASRVTREVSKNAPYANAYRANTPHAKAPRANALGRLRARIHKLRARLRKNIVHRRTLERQRVQLERSILFKQRQIQAMQGGAMESQVRDAEAQYKQLVAKQIDLRRGLKMLATEAEELVSAKNAVLERLQHINLEELIERHARGLPESMLGALRKSALVLTPFFDTLFTAADTNNRLVNHVGSEIDKYTHVNIRNSPFLSGMLFYCVLLVPALTIGVLFRSVVDKSTKLSASHFIIFGNIYIIVLCVIFVVATLLHNDPMHVLYTRYESFVILANLLLALYYVWYLAMLGVQTLHTWDNRNLAQFIAATTVGIHYFLFAWRRVFTDHAPQLYVHNYLVYVTIFAFITYERSVRINARFLLDNPLLRRLRTADIKVDLNGVVQTVSKSVRRHRQLLQMQVAAALETLRPRRWGWQRRRRGHVSVAPPEVGPRFARSSRGYASPAEPSSESSSSSDDSDDSMESSTMLSRTSASRTSFSRSNSSDEGTERRVIRQPWWQRWWWYGVRAERSRSEHDERAVAVVNARRERGRNPPAAWPAWQMAVVRLFGGVGWFGTVGREKQRGANRPRSAGRRGKYERSNARPRRDQGQRSGISQYLWKW